jgi:hypothetical protein
MKSALTKKIVLFFIFASVLCISSTINVIASEKQSPVVIKNGKVAVMPFFTGEYSSQIEMGKPPLQFLIDQIAVDEVDKKITGEKVLTRLMNEALLERLPEQLVPQDEVQNEFMHLAIDSMSDTPLAIAVRLGKSLQADYIVVGIVWEYKERIGSKMAAEEPASVSFSAFLVDVAAGQRIWREKYTKTQQSLSDNLLKAPEFFKQGAKWLSARDLSHFGIKKMLVSFPL